MQRYFYDVKIWGRKKSSLVDVQLSGQPVVNHELDIELDQPRSQPPPICCIQLVLQMCGDLVVCAEESMVCGHSGAHVDQKGYVETAITYNWSSISHPTVGQVPREVPEGTDIPWGDGTVI
jgi:hypothetical protein